jgi:hypothetical protein
VSYRGEHLGDPVVFLGKLAPDVHRELPRVHVMGNVVAVELSIRGCRPGRAEAPLCGPPEFRHARAQERLPLSLRKTGKRLHAICKPGL